MKYSSFFLAASLGILAACSGLETNSTDVVADDLEITNIVFNVPPVIDDDAMETRASAVPQSDYNVSFAWEETDRIGIFPNKGSQIFFVPEDGVGTSSASFDGGGWALKSNSTYISYYPFVADFDLDRNAIPISFAGQKQTGTEGPFDGSRWVLATSSTISQNGRLTFTYSILNTIINVLATLPAGTYTSASLNIAEPLFVEEGTFSLDDQEITGKTFSKKLEVELVDFTLTENAEVPIYFMADPIDLTGKEITVIITKDDGSRYKCVKTPSAPYNAGRRRGLTCAMQKDADIINFADPEVKRLCVENWDTDGDGELDMDEAAAVTDIGHVFSENSLITSFDEFKHFTGLTSLDGSYLDGGYRGFYNCRNLTVVTLPNTLTSIGYAAFYNCRSLVSLYIPSAVSSIPINGYWNWVHSYNCFVGCISLSSIIVSPDNMVYDSRDDCNAIIETTTNKMILGCKNTIIPNTVEIIGESALGGDPYDTYDFPDSIVIPDSVKEIKYCAFAFRTNLSALMCLAENPPVLDNYAFESTNNCPIYVPAGSVAAYKSASGWSNYSDRIFSIEGGNVPDPGNDGND